MSDQTGEIGAAPLRKVVARQQYVDTAMWQDVLECGHVLNEPTDVYGPQHERQRRRCFYCQIEAAQ